MISNKMKYNVGPLIYMPGLRNDIAEKIISFKNKRPLSVAICLEDTIADDRVEEAHKNTLSQIYKLGQILEKENLSTDDIPSVFIRVRDASQIKSVIAALGSDKELITGFILPKIDDVTIRKYMSVIDSNRGSSFVYMPIIENSSLLQLADRYRRLDSLNKDLLIIRPNILNIRIGGNDFCKSQALRCSIDHSIYDFAPIASLLSDIAVTFNENFVVSAPVWNYFDTNTDDRWKSGMIAEIEKDKLNGFIGKTVIHPTQIAIVQECMKVSRSDYNDAMLLKNTSNNGILVVKGSNGNMLEHKTHMKWADKIIAMADAYGIKD